MNFSGRINRLTYESIILGSISFYVLKKNGLIKVKLNSKLVLTALFILSIFAYHRSGWTALFIMIFALVILREIKASRIAITALGAAFLLFSSFVYYLPFLTVKFEGIFSPLRE